MFFGFCCFCCLRKSPKAAVVQASTGPKSSLPFPQSLAHCHAGGGRPSACSLSREGRKRTLYLSPKSRKHCVLRYEMASSINLTAWEREARSLETSAYMWPILGPSWAVLGLLGAILGHLWAILGPSWGIVGPSWGLLGAILGPLGPSWGHLGPSWGHLGAILGHLEGILNPS